MPSQAFRSFFALDGGYYFKSLSNLLDNQSFIDANTFCYIREGLVTINIDNEIDFKFAEFLSNDNSFSSGLII